MHDFHAEGRSRAPILRQTRAPAGRSNPLARYAPSSSRRYYGRPRRPHTLRTTTYCVGRGPTPNSAWAKGFLEVCQPNVNSAPRKEHPRAGPGLGLLTSVSESFRDGLTTLRNRPRRPGRSATSRLRGQQPSITPSRGMGELSPGGCRRPAESTTATCFHISRQKQPVPTSGGWAPWPELEGPRAYVRVRESRERAREPMSERLPN